MPAVHQHGGRVASRSPLAAAGAIGALPTRRTTVVLGGTAKQTTIKMRVQRNGKGMIVGVEVGQLGLG